MKSAAGMMEGVVRDAIGMLKRFRREPGFVAAVVLTFALAIGANAAVFGIVSRLLFAPPPGVANAEQLVRIGLRHHAEGGESYVQQTMSYPAFRALQSESRALASIAVFASDTMTVGRAPEVTRASVLGASADFFATLGAAPALGTVFRTDDDERIVVLGYAFWKRMYAGNPQVVGTEIVIDERNFTIAGIARRGFNGGRLAAVDVYMPLAAMFANRNGNWRTTHGMNIVEATGRLRDGVAPAVGGQLLTTALSAVAPPTPSGKPSEVELISVIPGKESRDSQQGRIALWLTAVSLIVLLIAAANVGTLLSIRAAKRAREHAVRLALGSSLARIARSVMMESVVLAVMGALAGILVSVWVSALIRRTLLPGIAGDGLVFDSRVLIESIAVTLVVGILAGCAPIVRMRQRELGSALREGSSYASTARHTLQRALVSVQVALCVVLLIGAALFVRSLERITSQDLGFSTSRLLYASLEFRGYVPASERDLAYAEASARISQLPGMSSTVAAGVPFGPHNIPPVSIPGFEIPPASQVPIMYGATPAYLRMMNVSLRSGRLFNERDGRGSSLVVLVNSTLEQTVWPGLSAVGRCLRTGFGPAGLAAEGNPAEGAVCREIVGVVSDSRARSLRPERNEDKLMQYYVPFEQLPDSPFGEEPKVMGLVIQSSGDLDRARALVERTMQAAVGRPVYARVRPYQDFIDPQLRSWRLGATLFSAFSVLALVIAAVGLFGVVSYMVTQRTREIGVRLALGGTRGAIASLILLDTLRIMVIGIAIGIPVALAGGPLLAASLFQTSPREPASIALAALVLLLTGTCAAILPAWRSTRVDPLIALRAES